MERFVSHGDIVEFSYNSRQAEAEALADRYGVNAIRLNFLGSWEPPDTVAEVLINNSGVNLSGHDLAATTDDEVRQSMEVNVIAPLRFARHFVPYMRRLGRGRVININSIYGLAAPRLRLSYAMTKFALRAFTCSLAQELAPHAITVNDICPGPVDSAMLRKMGADAVAAGRYPDLQRYLTAVGNELPLGRLIMAGEVATAAAFLASPAAAACTGLALRVDGGQLNQ